MGNESGAVHLGRGSTVELAIPEKKKGRPNRVDRAAANTPDAKPNTSWQKEDLLN
jgi:hypothetical protein